VPIAFTDPPGPEDLVNHDPWALLVAMLLDQQIPIEWACLGPARLADRLGVWDARSVAEIDPAVLLAAACAKPAIHRYPAVMARRIQDLARHLVEHHGSDAARIWSGPDDGAAVFERLADLPGFGAEKARITLAVLAKRFGHRPTGWEELAGVFADDRPRSVADIGGPDDLARLRAWRTQQKALGRTKTD
jgi:uncharacterized HhH-GPD family protein